MSKGKKPPERWTYPPGFVFQTPQHAYQYADHDDPNAPGLSSEYGRWCDAGGCFEVFCEVCHLYTSPAHRVVDLGSLWDQ